MKLFEIESHLEALDQIIEDSGGEITPEQEAWQERLYEDYENQMGWIHGLIKNRDADAKAAKEMEQHFKRKRVAAEKSVEFWKSVVKVALVTKKITKWKTYIGNLSIVNNSAPSIRVESDDALADLPADMKRIKVELDSFAAGVAYKDLIAEYIHEGQSEEAAEAGARNQMLNEYGIIVERGSHVRT